MAYTTFQPGVLVARPHNRAAKTLANMLRLVDPEQRLIAHYQRLLAEGVRSTPAVLLRGKEKPFSIVSPPTASNPLWVLRGGSKLGHGDVVERLPDFEVSFEQIRQLGTMNELSGHN